MGDSDKLTFFLISSYFMLDLKQPKAKKGLGYF